MIPLSNCIKYVSVLAFLFLILTVPARAQFGELPETNPGYIRVAQAGQLTDTLSLWGDIGRSGRYIIPQGTTALELISFGGGFGSMRIGNENAFSKTQIRITISRFNSTRNREEVTHFSFKHSDPVPTDLRQFRLSSEDVITLQVKRKPSLIDILGVVGPILSTVTASYFIYSEIIR